MQVFIPSVERKITPKHVMARIGEPVKINGIALTVTNVKTTKWVVLKSFSGERSFPSKEGYQFVMLFISINNTGTKSESIHIWNETITTDKGYTYEALSRMDIETRYDWSREPTDLELREYYCVPIDTWNEIPPGEWTGGCYYFEIKEDHEPATFSFRTELTGGKVVSIDLTRG